MSFSSYPIQMRVWLPQEKRFVYSSEAVDGGQGYREFIPFVFPIGFSHWETGVDIPALINSVTLYTGIVDSHGTKVYEFDRVRAPFGEGLVRYWPEKGAWVIELTQSRSKWAYLAWTSDLEVIGNIWEV